MKTLKSYNSFVNENVKHIKEYVESDLDQELVDYFQELIDDGLTRDEAIEQVAADFGYNKNAVAIVVDESGIKESKSCDDDECEEEEEDEEEDEEEVIEEKKKVDKEEEEDEEEDKSSKSDEDKYLSAKQKKLPEGLKKAIIKKAKVKEKK